MSKVPHARHLVEQAITHIELGNKLTAKKFLAEALPLMTRTYTKRRAAIESTCITPKIADEVKARYRKEPWLSCKKLAEIFDINAGRVSEILAGKYDTLGGGGWRV
jgi:hypothetical protein